MQRYFKTHLSLDAVERCHITSQQLPVGPKINAFEVAIKSVKGQGDLVFAP